MDEDRDQLPEELSADLGAMYRASPASSPQLDQAILNRAKASYAGRKRMLLFRRVGLVAAAACVVAAAGIPLLTQGDRSNHVAQITGDVNADGVVDIRDALALARKVEQKRATPQDDVNRDQVVDSRDVDAIAMMAVKVEAVR